MFDEREKVDVRIEVHVVNASLIDYCYCAAVADSDFLTYQALPIIDKFTVNLELPTSLSRNMCALNKSPIPSARLCKCPPDASWKAIEANDSFYYGELDEPVVPSFVAVNLA
jgi:hypothetical protein